jgi:hypothetical protein
MSSSRETKAPLETTSEDWSRLPWRKLERHVYQLQKRMCAVRRVEVSLA